ncbi:MAG: Gldg family protein [Pirellulales bacterium]
MSTEQLSAPARNDKSPAARPAAARRSGINPNVIRAVFRRNFVSYFSSPTGYVFICVYVLLCSFAAFWPAEFFNANLANLDQLNKVLPYILLVFIPAITMSVWADERRQGTDELLLTIPATDFDVVTGKYLAAVAIFTVALLFSMISNTLVLMTLGTPDLGLILGTHVGYWLVGVAMLAVGMVASFLTSNLTIAYILGAVFNVPLAFAASAELLVPSQTLAQSIRSWSLAEQLRDFSRGVISLPGAVYFLSIAAVSLYLAMVLIGRRHWSGGRDGQSMAKHYAVRFAALVLLAIGINVIFAHRGDSFRADMTTERLSSLSPKTRELLRSLDTKNPVVIDAYVSPVVPEAYVQQRLNLLSTLREVQALSGDKVRVNVHSVEPFSEAATRAEQQYNIRPQKVETNARGAIAQDDIFLGAAFTSGLEKVVVPFFTKGIPVEYEIVRSIATVGQQKRKRMGVLQTDVNLFAGFDMQRGMRSDEPLIEELRKQYDVIQVNPAQPITERFDVLLAVQPSSLPAESMDNFVQAVLAGQPTAIFEDPLPLFYPVAGTSEERRAQNQNPFMPSPPPPRKGQIELLWSKLGIDFAGKEVAWQNYNPYPKYGALFSKEWVFVSPESGNTAAFNPDSPISSGLQQALMPFPGYIRPLNASKLNFTELLATNTQTGTVGSDQVFLTNMLGQRDFNPDLPFLEHATGVKYVLGAHIKGKLPPENVLKQADQGSPLKAAADAAKGADPAKAAAPTGAPEINVVLMSDIDMLSPEFFAIRAQGMGEQVDFEFDNVTLVLNILDNLAGDDRFVDIRKRRPLHRTLGKVELATKEARLKADQRREQFNREYEKKRSEAQNAFTTAIKKIEEEPGLDARTRAFRMQMVQKDAQTKLDAETARLLSKRNDEIKQIETELSTQIRSVQDEYKQWAVILPPIPPLLVAFFVYFRRRSREQEGVSRSRLR